MRLRFAPSPTGYLHVGGLRTALYNYLLAKKSEGTLVLRIEDTDQNRLVKNAETNLIDMLKWSGIQFDEGPHVDGGYGPYRQSERLNIYKNYYLKIIESGHAYPCFYTAERLKDLESGAITSEEATMEDEIFQEFNYEDVINRMKKEKFVVRLKMPKNKIINHNDLVKGSVKFDLNLINDPILIKSDGFPTYHFANVVDDYLMGITHVVRGEEWLPSIPKHIALYQAFGWNAPQFAHLPLLLNDDKSKLSKRKNDVSVEIYKEKGFVSEALINFLALLGWHEKGDRELYTIDDLIKHFSLERVNKSGAIFDVKKLNSFNSHYIKNMDIKRLSILIKESTPYEWNINEEMINLVKDKAESIKDFKKLLSIFFEEVKFDEHQLQIIKQEINQNILLNFVEQYNKSLSLKDIAKKTQEKTNCKPKEFWSTIRIALTGQSHGPSLDSILNIYGQDKVLKLINNAIQKNYN